MLQGVSLVVFLNTTALLRRKPAFAGISGTAVMFWAAVKRKIPLLRWILSRLCDWDVDRSRSETSALKDFSVRSVRI
jgi:hypothetical protein